jgi:hypothetical protein
VLFRSSKWRGQDVTLVFATDGGPAGNTDSDWAHWGNIELSARNTGPLAPQDDDCDVVYSNEVAVYRNNHAFPRAFVLHQVEVAKDIPDALARLARPGFEPGKVAVIEEAFAQGLAPLAVPSTTLRPYTPAQVTERRSNSMTVKATLDRPGVLVVSDTYFPGWKATVDGQPAPILPVDVALRGVYLEAGAHEVAFVYAPWQFTVGVWISVAGLVVLAGWVCWCRRKVTPV